MAGFFQYIGVSVQFIAGMIFYIVVSRLFSTTTVGAIAFFIAIVGLFNVVFTFGMGSAAQHFISYHIGEEDYGKVGRVVKQITFISIFLSISGTLLLIAISPFISVLFLHDIRYVSEIRLLGVVLFGNILFGVLNGVLLGTQNFRISGLLNGAIWGLYYAVSILMSLTFKSLISIEAGWILGISIGVTIELYVVVKSTTPSFVNTIENGLKIKDIAYYSVPVLFSSVISYGAAYADRFIVAGLVNLSQLGIYNIALLISGAAGFIAFPFNNILLPKFSQWYAKGELLNIKFNFKLSYLLLSLVYVPTAVGIATISDQLVLVVFGHSYHYASTPLSIIMLVSAVFIGQNILLQALSSIGKTKFFIISSGIGFLANISLSLLLVPVLGIIGASIGYVSVYVTMYLVLSYFAKEYQIFAINYLALIKIWFSALTMGAIIYLINTLFGNKLAFIPIYIITGIVVYAIVIRFLKVFSNEERETILTIFSQDFDTIRKLISLIIL